MHAHPTLGPQPDQHGGRHAEEGEGEKFHPTHLSDREGKGAYAAFGGRLSRSQYMPSERADSVNWSKSTGLTM
jgi:hypothetical protein